jgi:eukaryotic-like serine/threonine-protein kinase
VPSKKNAGVVLLADADGCLLVGTSDVPVMANKNGTLASINKDGPRGPRSGARRAFAFSERFRIDGILGEGGMATVFAAHDVQLDRPVAIKRLREPLESEEAALRFLREAKVMARLSSEHTVRVYELGQDAHGAPYIVMERIRGRGLDELVAERGPLPPDEAIEYVRQACLALEEAHACGIVHRDVKPSNILIEEGRTSRVRVVDFGVAKARPHSEDRSGLTSISALLGTPEYMAPEQLYSAREVDHRADIWGLGATLYFMLAGEPPFAAPDLWQLLHKIQHVPTPSVRTRRPDVAPHLEAVIARCMHRDPFGRYRSVAELARSLAPLDAIAIPSFAEESGPLGEMTVVTVTDRELEPEVTERMPAASLLGAPPPTHDDLEPAKPSSHWTLPTAVAVGAIAGAALSQLLGQLLARL